MRVFFYGSFMNRSALAEAGLVPARIEPARLWGFDIRIQPLANLVPSERHCVHGILCEASGSELDRLYGQGWVRAYRPEAVIVGTRGGGLVPALCYIAPPQERALAAGDYLDRIVGAAREHGFPGWYIERLEGFRHGGAPEEEVRS